MMPILQTGYILYNKVCSKWQFEIFSAFFFFFWNVIYDILSKHDQYSKHIGYMNIVYLQYGGYYS